MTSAMISVPLIATLAIGLAPPRLGAGAAGQLPDTPLPKSPNGWRAVHCDSDLFPGGTPWFGDCDVVIGTVEAVSSGEATNAHPPTVLFRIDEVLDGYLKPGRVHAVWGEHFKTLCGVGAEEAERDWRTRPVPFVPRAGERWIVGGGMSRDRKWFEAVPDKRFRFSPAERAKTLRQLRREHGKHPSGHEQLRRRQDAEDRAAVRDDQLIAAVEAADTKQVEALLRSGVRASATDGRGMTALYFASQRGAVAIARLLLAAGAPANQGYRPPPGVARLPSETPLHAAAREGHSDMVSLLVRSGAAVDRSHLGVTPLATAASSRRCEAVRALIQAGADVERAVKGGTLPLTVAAERGGAECVRLLLDAGARPNRTDAYGTTPLMRAAFAGDTSVVDLLLARGANPRLRTRRGATAADFAYGGSTGTGRHAEYQALIEKLKDKAGEGSRTRPPAKARASH